MCACANGHEAVVRVLLESEKVTAESIGKTDQVTSGRDSRLSTCVLGY
jgi:hypothetical protein